MESTNIEIESSVIKIEPTTIISKLETSILELNFSTSTSKIEYTTSILDFTEKFTNIICYNTCYICNELPVFNESGIAINHNCQRCKEGYFFKNGTNNCYNDETIEKGYYLDVDENIKYWKECYEKCE